VLRVVNTGVTADAEALKRDLAARLKATVLIQMDIELVSGADIPEAAGPPRFAAAMIDRRARH